MIIQSLYLNLVSLVLTYGPFLSQVLIQNTTLSLVIMSVSLGSSCLWHFLRVSLLLMLWSCQHLKSTL